MEKGLEAIGVLATIAIVVVLGGLVVWFYFWSQSPPACASDISASKARASLVEDLTNVWKYSNADVATLQIDTLEPDQDEGDDHWLRSFQRPSPNYVVSFHVNPEGAVHRFVGEGNGCGFGDLDDVSG